MISFVLGMIIAFPCGAIVGIVIMCCCVAAKRGDGPDNYCGEEPINTTVQTPTRNNYKNYGQAKTYTNSEGWTAQMIGIHRMNVPTGPFDE